MSNLLLERNGHSIYAETLPAEADMPKTLALTCSCEWIKDIATGDAIEDVVEAISAAQRHLRESDGQQPPR